MPAAAVIPAPIAYNEVVAVEKLVVGFLEQSVGRTLTGVVCLLRFICAISFCRFGWWKHQLVCRSFTVSKTECSKQA